MHDEALREQTVGAIHLREHQTPTPIPTPSLPERAGTARDVRRLPAPLVNRLMPSGLKDLRLGRPEVAVAGAAPVGQAAGRATTGLLAAVTEDKGHHLRRAPTQRLPTFVLLSCDKAIDRIEIDRIEIDRIELDRIEFEHSVGLVAASRATGAGYRPPPGCVGAPPGCVGAGV